MLLGGARRRDDKVLYMTPILTGDIPEKMHFGMRGARTVPFVG